MAVQIPISITVRRFFRTFPQKYETVEWTHPTTGETELRARAVKGQRTEEHWVEYSPLGSDKTVINARVRELMNVSDAADGRNNPTIAIAAARWDAIRPLYENWLKGIEPTADGTPLAAWAGAEPSVVEVLRLRGITTVQELARLNDTHIQSYGIPGLRTFIDNAKTYLSTIDSQVLVEQMHEKDQRISSLEEDLAEMKAMLADVVKAKASGGDPLKALKDSDFDDPDFVDPRAEEELEVLADIGPERDTPSSPKRRSRA